MFARRSAGLILAVAAVGVTGCGQQPPRSAAPPADPVADTTPVAAKPADPPAKPKREPKPGQIVLPEGGGQWPWNLNPAVAAEPTRPATITGTKGWLTGMAVSPASRRAVVTFGDAPLGGKVAPWTRVSLCDLAGGRVLCEWQVGGKYDVLDLSPDGRHLLLRKGDYRERDTLHLWTVTEQLTLKRRNWAPHDPPKADMDDAIVVGTDTSGQDESRDVRWAGFAGADRIVTVSKLGQLRVWDAVTLNRIGSIDARPATPALTPEGNRIVFLSGAGAALLDPTDAKVIGVKRFRPPEGDNVLAVSTDGKMLACTGTGRMRFMDLTGSGVWDAIMPQITKPEPYERRNFGWVSSKYLLYEELLIDPDFPIPVWRYQRSDLRCQRGREVWALMRPTRETAVVRGFTLPHRGLEASVAAKKNDPALFVLRPGDGVRIDVAGIPTARREWVRDELRKRLAAVGYRADEAGAAVLVASEDTTSRTVSATYVGTASGTVKYQSRPARLKLMKDGKVLWEDYDSIGADSVITLGKSQTGRQETLDDKAVQGGWGEPDYDLFATARIPPMFPGRHAPQSGFGGLEFSPAGLKESGNRGTIVD